MNLQCIAEHTVDVDALPRVGWVLDAGCRDFQFAREMAARGLRVVALDPDPTIEEPEIEGVFFRRCGLAAAARGARLVMSPQPQARHLEEVYGGEGERVEILLLSNDDLVRRYAVDRWAVVKLDVEGAEIDILKNWPGPIAEQITVEFHEHVKPQPEIDAVVAHLDQWYRPARHVRDQRFCAGENYWDSLFVLK